MNALTRRQMLQTTAMASLGLVIPTLTSAQTASTPTNWYGIKFCRGEKESFTIDDLFNDGPNSSIPYPEKDEFDTDEDHKRKNEEYGVLRDALNRVRSMPLRFEIDFNPNTMNPDGRSVNEDRNPIVWLGKYDTEKRGAFRVGIGVEYELSDMKVYEYDVQTQAVGKSQSSQWWKHREKKEYLCARRIMPWFYTLTGGSGDLYLELQNDAAREVRNMPQVRFYAECTTSTHLKQWDPNYDSDYPLTEHQMIIELKLAFSYVEFRGADKKSIIARFGTSNPIRSLATIEEGALRKATVHDHTWDGWEYKRQSFIR